MTMTDHDDEEQPRFSGRLAFIIVKHIGKQLRRHRKDIMAAIDELNSKVDALAAAEANVETVVTQLRAAQGTPDDQVLAVAGKLQTIVDAMNAVVTPPAPVPSQ